MVSNVLAAAAILRQHYRRLRSIGLLGSLTALGLVPLALYMPRVMWTQYILLSLVCLYAGRKTVQFFRSRGALKQLSMEEHFLRYGSTDGQVRKCIENEANLWTRSCILAALKEVAPRRLPEELLFDQKKDRVFGVYRRSFRQIIPHTSHLDLLLLCGILLIVFAAPMIEIDPRAVMFQAGFLALGMAAVAEVSHVFVTRRLSGSLHRLFDSLSTWTLGRGLVGLTSRSPAYAHHLHYFAHPWFASGGVGSEFEGLVFSGPGTQHDTLIFSGDAVRREAVAFRSEIADSVDRAFSGDGGVATAEAVAIENSHRPPAGASAAFSSNPD
ncbi:MAG: hypothetical protein WD275_08835 [Rhodothermales bacterium]